MSRFINPIPQYILSNGDVVAGGTLTFYEFNTDTLLDIYADNDETIPLANPVALGDRGEVPNIFFSTEARVVLEDADGNQIFDIQPTAGTAAGGAGGSAAWSPSASYRQLQIVYGSDEEFYISNVNGNLGNDPADDRDDSEFWTRLELLRFWNNLEQYGIGDIVLRGSTFYISQIEDNLSNDPSSSAGAWKDLTSADLSPYNNASSGLVADNVQTAIDEIRAIVRALTQPFIYKGVLDVSAGDSALPASPDNGDVYVIGIGGTITISINGLAPTPTEVNQGQVIGYNSTFTRWDLLPPTQIAALVSYANTQSGLQALDVQTAIDEIEGRVDVNETNITALQQAVEGLGQGVSYKGQLDVSAGDSALPAAPEGGDLYGIAVGGTITVSVDGGLPEPTEVQVGEQIVYNAFTPAWDLIGFVTQAGQIGYDNSVSGLQAINVQAAIDEVDQAAKDAVDLRIANATQALIRQAQINDVSKTNSDDVTLTIDETGVQINDLFRIRKTLEAGQMTVITTSNQVAADGQTDTQGQFTDGTAGTVELKYTGTEWALRTY